MGTKWIETMWSRRKRRKSLATALLEELRTVELNVRYLAEHPEPARRPGGDLSPLFKRVVDSDDLLLFKSDLISLLIGFVGVLTDIDEAIVEFRQSDRTEHLLHGTVKTKAFFAAGRIAPLKSLLERAGGSPPRHEPLQSLDPDELPPLPPAAFAEWSLTAERNESTRRS